VAEWAKWKPTFFDGVNTLFELLLNNEKFRTLDHSHLKSSIGAGMKVLAETQNNWEKLTGCHLA
jgi:long-chain acyl-CoA synthetase